jgi:anti-sigma factor RsiW
MDGELSPPEREAVREHLSGCTRCARVYDQHRHLAELLDSQPGASVPGDFAARVRRAAAGRQTPVKILTLDPPWQQAFFRVAALLVLAVGLGFGLLAGNAASRGFAGAEETPDQVAIDPLSATPQGSLAELYLGLVDDADLNGGNHAQ